MNDIYLDLLWSSFKRIFGPVGAWIAIALAFIFWCFLPSQSVQLSVALPVLIVLVMLVMTLFDANRELIAINVAEKNKIKLPRIISSQTEQGSIGCLLEPSDLFSEDIAVSFYYAPSGSFERRIGVGHVELIRTSDKKIQVKLIQPVEGYAEIINGLANNDENILKDVLIKPNIPRSYLNS
jgi:hypothetical protein